MKIAYFTSRFPSSSEVPILNQIVGLIKAGHDLTIFAEYKDDDIIHRDIELYGLQKKVLYFAKQPLYLSSNKWINKFFYLIKSIPIAIDLFKSNPKVFFKCLNILKYKKYSSSLWLMYNAHLIARTKWDFDITFAQFGPNGEKAAVLKDVGLLKSKLVTNFRGYDLNVIPRTSLFFKNYSYLKKNGNWYICNTNFMKKRLIELGFDIGKISVVPSAIQIEKFNVNNNVLQERSKLKIVSVGRLVECKGIEYGIQAINLLTSRFPKMELEYLIVGDGPLKEELKELTVKMKLENVKFLGWKEQDEVISIMKECHIFLHPGIRAKDGSEEAQGLVIQEAQAIGLAVIASDIGGISDGLLDGKSGYLVPEKEIEMIVEKIVQIVDNDEFDRLGAEGIKFVKANYSQKHQIEKILEIFDNI